MDTCDPNISIVDLTESFTMVDHRGFSSSVIVLDDSVVENSQKKKKKQRAQSAKLPSKPRLFDETDVPKKSKSLIKIKDKENQRPPRSECMKSSRTIGECTICWDELGKRPMASTKCGHVFCLKCLKHALNINRTCPICRKYLKSDKSYHQLYLGGDF